MVGCSAVMGSESSYAANSSLSMSCQLEELLMGAALATRIGWWCSISPPAWVAAGVWGCVQPGMVKIEAVRAIAACFMTWIMLG